MGKILKNKKVIALLIVVILIIILVVSISFFHKKDESKLPKPAYGFTGNVVEEEGTFIRDIDSLKKSHCVDNICVKNLMIYYKNKNGRIEIEIVNNNKRSANGKLTIKFDNDVKYNIEYDLKGKETIKTSIQYDGDDLSNVYDYTLKKAVSDSKKKGK